MPIFELNNYMLSQETTEYYNKWMIQYNNITGTEPKDHFSRFRILYPLQNRLYSDASADLLDKSKIQSRGGNKKEATINLVNFLGAAKMLQEFQKNNNGQDIQHLIEILENKVFNITLTMQGIPIPHRDQELLDGLRSVNEEEKAQAIALTIYQVRCNDTHGAKTIDGIQPLLLEPINNILYTINDMLYRELSK